MKIDITKEKLKIQLDKERIDKWHSILEDWKKKNPGFDPATTHSDYLHIKSLELFEEMDKKLADYDNAKNQNNIAIEENANAKILDLNEKIKLIETKRKINDKRLKDLLYKKLSRNKDLLNEVYNEAGFEIDDSILNNWNLPKKQKIIL